MMVPRPLRTCLQTIRKPGKSGPASSRSMIHGLRSGRLHQKHPVQSKTLLSPRADYRAHEQRSEGFAKPMSSEPAPSHRPWIGALGATPACRALPYHAQLQLHVGEHEFLGKLKVPSCRIRCSAGVLKLMPRSKGRMAGFGSTEADTGEQKRTCFLKSLRVKKN